MTMSRRSNAVSDRATQNQQTLKTLVKLEGNKTCADCKRNKHPRWASWNLGVFVCIRCSGIHRGMGTHISRVKSVDLDAWTDEQMRSILQWGNVRANKYWESKLAPGHVPSEAKIENFIRTKYESKRWVMDGPMPDPSTLDDADDDEVPLGVVHEKQKVEQSSSSASAAPQRPEGVPPVDLFGQDGSPARKMEPIAGPSTVSPSVPPSKPSKPADTLLGLDFLGSSSAANAEADASGGGNGALHAPATSSRPDLKQSILSLYASTPRPAATKSAAREDQPVTGQDRSPQPWGVLNDAFGGLNFSGPSSTSRQAPVTHAPPGSPLGTLGNPKATPAAPQLTPSSISGGSFFDLRSKSGSGGPRPNQPSTSSRQVGSGSPSQGPPTSIKTQPALASANVGDLFDFPASSAPPPPPKPSTGTQESVFNLTASQPPPPPPLASSGSKPPLAPGGDIDVGWASTDPWTSNNEWRNGGIAGLKPPVVAKPPGPASMTATASAADDLGWAGNALSSGPSNLTRGPAKAPEISADEDFGSWSSAVPATTNKVNPPPSLPSGGGKAGGFGPSASEDLFSNVWQ